MANKLESFFNTPITRRVAIGTTAVPVLAACRVFQPTPTPTPDLPPIQEYIDAVSLRDSIEYVKKEMDEYRELNSIDDYDAARLFTFTGHAYNIFVKTTGSPLTPTELLRKTTYGRRLEIERAFISDVVARGKSIDSAREYLADAETSVAKVYSSGHPQNHLIVINRDNRGFTKKNLRDDHPGKRPTVLGFLLYTLTHEPHHVENIPSQLPKPLKLQLPFNTITIDEVAPFHVYGSQATQPDRYGGIATEIDEIATYIIQEDTTAQTLGTLYEQYPFHIPQTIQLTRQLFRIMGFSGGRQLLEFKHQGGTALLAAERLAPHIPPEFHQDLILRDRTEAALFLLAQFSDAAGNSNIPRMADILRRLR